MSTTLSHRAAPTQSLGRRAFHSKGLPPVVCDVVVNKLRARAHFASRTEDK
ncbi:hypothetical protein ZHAS_00007630 [Anopheles sinensis]|uniref:Uncharacterized protein n=1 Tax=Anopheles sinensis TaxID=74873 RepID=A0A084VQ54_ANOSI|nr:hypothetical protein ZHAS_00007630 [Anopheles sinensis]